MLKHAIFQALLARRMVAIIRASSVDAALKMSEACIAGGIKTLEVAFTTPDALEVINTLHRRHGSDVLLGAGTVLGPEAAQMAILAGAKFIISPSLHLETIRLCQRFQILSMPGVMTPTEIMTALEAGADILKIFPAEVFGPAYIKALRAPLPQAPLMPTGGVTLDNLGEWFENGAIAVGIGSSLTAPAANGDYQAVTARAQEFVRRMGTIQLNLPSS